MNKQSLGIDYQPTRESPLRLDMTDRVMLSLYERDKSSGRTEETGGWYNDLRQALFMFSPALIHSAELTLLRIIYWDEAEEYGDPTDQYDSGLELPPGYVGVAHVPEGTRQKFRLALRKLLRRQHIHAFVRTLRALKGCWGKTTPIPQLWSLHNRDKLSEIIGISLTAEGFKAASSLASQAHVMHHWQVHWHAVQDEVFAAWLTGQQQTLAKIKRSFRPRNKNRNGLTRVKTALGSLRVTRKKSKLKRTRHGRFLGDIDGRSLSVPATIDCPVFVAWVDF